MRVGRGHDSWSIGGWAATVRARLASLDTKADPTGRNAVRKGRWDVPKSRFEIYEQITQLYDALFWSPVTATLRKVRSNVRHGAGEYVGVGDVHVI